MPPCARASQQQSEAIDRTVGDTRRCTVSRIWAVDLLQVLTHVTLPWLSSSGTRRVRTTLCARS